jgi:hypothetical protein
MNVWEPIRRSSARVELVSLMPQFQVEITKPKRVKVKLLDDPVNNPSHYTARWH